MSIYENTEHCIKHVAPWHVAMGIFLVFLFTFDEVKLIIMSLLECRVYLYIQPIPAGFSAVLGKAVFEDLSTETQRV